MPLLIEMFQTESNFFKLVDQNSENRLWNLDFNWNILILMHLIGLSPGKPVKCKNFVGVTFQKQYLEHFESKFLIIILRMYKDDDDNIILYIWRKTATTVLQPKISLAIKKVFQQVSLKIEI